MTGVVVNHFPCQYARLVSASALCAALLGCEVPRPEDAFWPSEGGADAGAAATSASAGAVDPAASFVAQADASVALPSGFSSTGASTGAQGTGGAAVPATGTASSTAAGSSAGGPSTGSSLDAPVQALVGRYLMRLDIFSVAQLRESLVSADLPTRVSYLYITELQPSTDGHGLVGVERLCHQTFESSCSPSCSASSQALTASIQHLWRTNLQRTYRVEGQKIVGEGNAYRIGYDDPSDTADPPGAANDARTWDSGNGFQVRASFTKGVLSADCTARTTQRLSLSFTGTAGGTAAAPSLAGSRDLQANVSATRTGDLGSEGDDSCPKNPRGVSSLDSGSRSVLRFAALPASISAMKDTKTLFTEACPAASVWDTALPGDAP
jgi:hypothetical protein